MLTNFALLKIMPLAQWNHQAGGWLQQYRFHGCPAHNVLGGLLMHSAAGESIGTINASLPANCTENYAHTFQMTVGGFRIHIQQHRFVHSHKLVIYLPGIPA